MFLEEGFDRLHVQPVVLVWIPFQGWSVQVSVSEIGLDGVLLILHVIVVHSWQLASLPREVADVERMMQRSEEQHPVRDKGELVDVPQLYWILSFDHFNIKL